MDDQTRKKGPGIIAMKGLPCTGKTTLALTLSMFLHGPILHHDDVRSRIAPLNLSSLAGNPPADQLLDEMSFESLCRCASNLLKLDYRVIIDSPLSDRKNLHQLIQLSNGGSIPLVVVDCKPQAINSWYSWLEQRVEGNDSTEKYPYKKLTWDDQERIQELQGASDYEIDDVKLLVVDTTATIENYHIHFAVEELLSSKDVRHEELPKWTPELLVQKDYSDKEAVIRPQPQVEEEVQIYEWYLIFQFAYNWRSESGDEPPSCGKCHESISGRIYNCNQHRVLLHQSCAESPEDVLIRPNDELPYLIANGDVLEYSFPQVERCNRCAESHKEFSDDCDTCLFQAHLKCNLLPTVVHHECHNKHPLFLRVSSISTGTDHFTTYQCDACGDAGKNMWYFCEVCNLKCHAKCVLGPPTVKNRHHRHILTRKSTPEHDSTLELICNGCEERREPSHWIYNCEECDHFACHLNCVTLLDENKLSRPSSIS